MSGVELAACPFCGGVPEKVGALSSQCRGMVNGKEVHNTIVMNNAAWNRRAVPMEAVAWREKVAEALYTAEVNPPWDGAGARTSCAYAPWSEVAAWQREKWIRLAGVAIEVQALALIPQAEDQETVK